MRNLLLFFLFFLILMGCKKFVDAPKKQCFIPFVDFVAQHVNPSTLEVSFTPVTTYNGTITSYKWDFGDGTTFDGPNPPAHKYPAPTANNGAHYKVRLTVANECGESYWTQDVVVSSCLPDTKFSFRFVNDSTVEFTNQTKTEGTTSYTWNFGDGTSGANSETIFVHIYKEDHPYVVSLKAINSCGENNYTDTISVCRKPVPSQTVTITACGVVNINASASTNGAKYQWDFGNGTVLPATPSTTSSISYTYPNSGTYTIKLKVFNTSGCDSATISDNITVTASSLGGNNDWSYTSDDLDFNFTRASVTNATSYKWNFGDGATSVVQNPTHSFSNPGNYTITLSASNSCGATYEFSVPINVPYYKSLSNIPATGFQQVLAFSPSLIYFLGTNGKLYKTDTTGNWSTISLPPGLSFNNDTRLLKDSKDNLWVYGKKEVAVLNGDGTSWTSYFSSTGFGNTVTINSIAVDYNNNVLWTIGGGKLHQWDVSISSGMLFSSIAFAENTEKVWLTSLSSNNLYYINRGSSQVNTVNTSGNIVNGSDEIKVNSTGEIYFTTGAGIVRTNSSGNVINNYNSSNTNGLINKRPAMFDFDSQGNLWVLLSGQLYKLPVANSTNTKKYSFNADLGNISWISVLNLSGTDSDILLAKTSGNAAIKIR